MGCNSKSILLIMVFKNIGRRIFFICKIGKFILQTQIMELFY